MKLELTLARITLTDKVTLGILRNGVSLICYTLEDKVRPPGEKVYAETAIPIGRYQVRMTYSIRFKKIMPLLMDVPMFAGIRIHGGQTEKNTEGCILVGMHKDMLASRIYDCTPAINTVYRMIAANEMQGGTWLTITNPTGE